MLEIWRLEVATNWARGDEVWSLRVLGWSRAQCITGVVLEEFQKCIINLIGISTNANHQGKLINNCNMAG
jgi:hypothetical protein